MADWYTFFPARTHVLALPSWKAPRLYISADTASRRWRRSAFYPAFRVRARIYRLMLRLEASLSIRSAIRNVEHEGWPLRPFVEDVLPGAVSVSVLLGTPGPAQKTTVQLWNERDQVIGYLKYGEKPAAKQRVAREFDVLSSLPPGTGPRPLKFGPYQEGVALLTSPVAGQPVPVSLPPPSEILAITSSLQRDETVAVDRHPWIRALGPGSPAAPWLDALQDRAWPRVIQHGDFVPWNLTFDAGGAIRAFDWEYGTQEGFPYLDLAYYLLQVGAKIYHWDPRQAANRAEAYLTGELPDPLTRAEADSLVRLTAYDIYRKLEEDGFSAESASQQWWRTVWERDQ